MLLSNCLLTTRLVHFLEPETQASVAPRTRLVRSCERSSITATWAGWLDGQTHWPKEAETREAKTRFKVRWAPSAAETWLKSSCCVFANTDPIRRRRPRHRGFKRRIFWRVGGGPASSRSAAAGTTRWVGYNLLFDGIDVLKNPSDRAACPHCEMPFWCAWVLLSLHVKPGMCKIASFARDESGPSH